jgi:hypothetical protein
MFRRLAEAFQNPENDTGGHDAYIKSQNKYFNSVPNMLLSGTSGLKGLNNAIHTISSDGNQYEPTFTNYPDNIVMSDTSSKLNNMAAECSASSIDQLLAIKNPNASVGCGWLYTPPPQGSPYPTLSKGFIGTASGPLQSYNPPEYKQWFFDLQMAKKQALIDTCKSLKSCADINSPTYNGICGYCEDTNTGVPVDATGGVLYTSDSRASCNSNSIVLSSINCPAPPGTGSGPQPIIDKTCQPTNGRLSADCLYSKLLTAGCNDKGTLALALKSPSSSPNDYISNIHDGDSVKIYNRVANPPLKLDVFSQGATTVDVVLQEARQLVANTLQPTNTALGAAARDLCLQSGAINNYDFCSDIADTTPPPFDISCLQKLFLKMGGQPAGLSYPGSGNLTNYNSMSNMGAVKQYFNQLVANMNSSDYNTQRNALIQFLGITPEQMIPRVPYTQGIEVLWFQAIPGKPGNIYGLLKRTIENDIVQFTAGSTSIIPQIAMTFPGFSQYATMLQTFDLRAPQDFTTQLQILSDDSCFITLNQPSIVESDILLNSLSQNGNGVLSNMGLANDTLYTTTSCFNYSKTTPNVMKLFYQDAGGGAHTFSIKSIGGAKCTGTPTFSRPYYSLPLEPRAPFINFEVNEAGTAFEDTRNPVLFGQITTRVSLDIHSRTDDRMSVPGKKGYVRFTNNNSYVNITNIAYQAWGTVTFAFRLQSMPVKDAIFTFWVNNKYFMLYLQPINGSTAQMRVQTTITTNNTVSDTPTNFTFTIGNWYFLEVAQAENGFDIYCDSINNIIKSNNFTTSSTKLRASQTITTTANNGFYLAGKYSCNIGIGGKISGFNFYNAVFQFDIAWVHFYDYYISIADVIKDCNSAWQFTGIP